MRPSSVHLEIEPLEPRALLSTAPLAAVLAPPPSAYLQYSSATITSGGVYRLAVVYKDSSPLTAWSLHTGNLLVLGANRFGQTVGLVSVQRNGAFTTAIYAVDPPHGSWTSADDGVYTVFLRDYQVFDRKGPIPGGAIGTFRVEVPAPDWFDAHLADSELRSLVRADDRDGVLSRQDLLGIFKQAGQEGVTAAVFHDLQTIVAYAGLLGMPGYVGVLSAKVVDGDPANAEYQGHPLGNLRVGGVRQLALLVDKWFLGEDEPATFPGLHYEYAQGSLFGAGVSYQDVIQGSANDCYFLAGLTSLAARSPAAIRGLFIDNGDGTFTVRFLRDGRPDYVTVDRELPATDEGSFAYADVGQSLSNPKVKLWAALLEKAYAQLAESGWSRQTPQPNAYASIDDGWEGDVVEQLTGQAAAFRSSNGSNADFQAIVGAFEAGKLIGLDTSDHTSFDLVPNHVYVVVGVNASSHLLQVYNPWGLTQQLGWSLLAGNLSGYSVTTG